MYATRILADYVCTLRADDLSAAARDAAIRCVLDLVGAAAAGFATPGAAGTRRVAREIYGDGGVPVWFTDGTSTAGGAVLCNSTAASALDLDDGNRAARGHPGAAVIPAALAIASEMGAAAEDVIAAIVAGYEVGVRVATARNAVAPPSRQSGRWSGYAAAAAAARLRGTTPQRLSQAFAIAGVTAPNQEANGSSGYSALTGNDVKEGIPWSSVAGITALHLAEAGLTGPEDILDHTAHFARAQLLDGLGSEPKILATYFKPYSCCRYNHAAIDALIALMTERSLVAGDIIAVDVHTFGWALKLGNKTEPQNLVDAQYSIPFCMGLAAVAGAEALLPLEAAALDRQDAAAFARKVTLHLDPALDARFPAETLARVVVVTAGCRFESPVTTPRGEPSHSLSSHELREKFLLATRQLMPVERQQAVLAAIDRFAQGDLQPLLRALATPVRTTNADGRW
jgi:2-methylcitrate dehydratase PrpD